MTVWQSACMHTTSTVTSLFTPVLLWHVNVSSNLLLRSTLLQCFCTLAVLSAECINFLHLATQDAKAWGTATQSDHLCCFMSTPAHMLPTKMRISTSGINQGPQIPFWLTSVTYKTPNHILSKPATLIKYLIFIHHSAPIFPQAFLTRWHRAQCTPLYAPPLSCRCSPQLNYSSPIYPLTAAYTASRSPPVNKYSLC